MLLPGCREKVACERKLDGKLTQKNVDVRIPANSACSDDIPPRIVCARGYQKGSGGRCERKWMWDLVRSRVAVVNVSECDIV